MRNFLDRLVSEEDGATMVEYGLMVGLIAAICVGVIGTLGTGLLAKFTTTNAALN